MKVKITSYTDKNKVFDLMKHITEKFPLEKDSKVVLNDDDTISLYLVVSDISTEEHEKYKEQFGPNISDEEIPF